MRDISTAVREQYDNKKMFMTAVVMLAVYGLFFFISTTKTADAGWGWKSLLPTFVVVLTAVLSRKPFEAMLTGCVAGLVMIDPYNLIAPFTDNISKVMGDETIVWVILVCGLMGGFIRLLEISGCLNGFTEWLKERITNRRQALLSTAILGVVVFIDDYLNCLAVSSSVKKLTDFYAISREKVAYLIDSTAAPMCVIVPISTWAVFFAGLLEENGVAGENQGMSLYVSSIPFMIYAWAAIIVAFLVANGIIGDFGPMKKAEARAASGHPIPPEYEGEELSMRIEAQRELSMGRQLFNFFFPMALLVTATVYYDIDLLKGVITTCAVTAIMFYLQGILSFESQTNAIFDGFKTMLYPLSTVIASFFLKEVNDSLGMTEYVINSVTPYMSQATYPAIVFTVLALVVFGTSSSWGIFIIAIPIVIPIAQHLDVYMPLVIGALLSASSFGSHSCFFSDSSVLASQGAGCTPMQHAFSQFPYALVGASCALVIFFVLGHLFAM
ncbi:MAG: sodium:proton antiporter [Gammaproteobacteria bacterium]|nr:MAG: sodium:proton antiporter [Gammaproteobacteria bacterium]